MMKNACRLLAFCFMAIFLLANNVSAKHKALGSLEEMRKYQGAELLGAADRAAYKLSGEDRDVLVLLLESELKKNLPGVVAQFASQDTQEVMRSAFGDRFDAERIDSVADYTVRGMLRQVLDSGYIIEQKDGRFYPALDYGYLYDTYAGRTSGQVGEYFYLRKAWSLAQPTHLSSRAVFLVMAEKYLKKYPNAFRKPDVNYLYREQLFSYFLIKQGKGFSPNVTDEDRQLPDVLNAATAASYRQLAKEFSDSRSGRFAKQILLVWEKAGYNRTSDVEKKLVEYGQQMDDATMEKVEGVYTDDFGVGVFKAAASKDYLAVQGKADLLIEGSMKLTGKKDGYIVAVVEGVRAKNLPQSVAEVIYQEAFIVDRVLSVSPWQLDSKLFPADFLLLGVEPFWNMRILTGDEVIFDQASAETAEVFPYSTPVKEKCSEHKSRCWHYDLKKGLPGVERRLQVVIVKEAARDPMAGIQYKYQAQVEFDGHIYEGFAFRPSDKLVNPNK